MSLVHYDSPLPELLRWEKLRASPLFLSIFLRPSGAIIRNSGESNVNIRLQDFAFRISAKWVLLNEEWKRIFFWQCNESFAYFLIRKFVNLEVGRDNDNVFSYLWSYDHFIFSNNLFLITEICSENFSIQFRIM